MFFRYFAVLNNAANGLALVERNYPGDNGLSLGVITTVARKCHERIYIHGCVSKERAHKIIKESGDRSINDENQILVGPLQFINHDCIPNCEYTGAVGGYMVATLKPIAANEEIFVSYSKEYWDEFECTCSHCTEKQQATSEKMLVQRSGRYLKRETCHILFSRSARAAYVQGHSHVHWHHVSTRCGGEAAA